MSGKSITMADEVIKDKSQSFNLMAYSSTVSKVGESPKNRVQAEVDLPKQSAAK